MCRLLEMHLPLKMLKAFHQQSLRGTLATGIKIFNRRKASSFVLGFSRRKGHGRYFGDAAAAAVDNLKQMCLLNVECKHAHKKQKQKKKTQGCITLKY